MIQIKFAGDCEAEIAPEAGSCDEKWGYDETKKTCISYRDYGDDQCPTTGNQFDTKEECVNACIGD